MIVVNIGANQFCFEAGCIYDNMNVMQVESFKL